MFEDIEVFRLGRRSGDTKGSIQPIGDALDLILGLRSSLKRKH